LDSDFFLFGKFDIVYAWGVLHHTGRMWDSIKRASELVGVNGIFAIAIYNKHWSSPLWKKIKRIYNNCPRVIRMSLVGAYIFLIVVKSLAMSKNPFACNRGMSFYFDAVDWIGGYPYEYASTDEIIRFVTAQGFRVVKVIPTAGMTGNNEFVFRRQNAMTA